MHGPMNVTFLGTSNNNNKHKSFRKTKYKNTETKNEEKHE